MIRWVLLAIFWTQAAFAQGVFVSAAPSWVAQFQSPSAAKASSYGVVCDSSFTVLGTDNTSALNSLPANVPIINDACDGHPGQAIGVNGDWKPQSGTIMWDASGLGHAPAPIVSFVNNVNDVFLTQTTAATPLVGLNLYQFWVQKPNHATLGQLILMNVNHLVLENWYVPLHNGFAKIQGDDQEIAWNLVFNSSPAVGNPGIRLFGNVPATTRSASLPPGIGVYIHNNYIEGGDAIFQSCQPNNTGVLENISTDGVEYLNNNGISWGSAVELTGIAYGTVGQSQYYCQNIFFVGNHGLGHRAILNEVGPAPMYVSNLQSINESLGGLPNHTQLVEFLSTADGTFTNNLISNLTVTQVFNGNTVFLSGGQINLTMNGGTVPSAANSIASTFLLEETASNVIIENWNVDDRSQAFGFLIGPNGTPVTGSLQLLNNTITNTRASQPAYSIRNADNVTVSGGSITGVNSAIGLMTASGPNPGTTNSSVTGVTVGSLAVTCATGQGNTVKNNPSAADCAP